jgi:hypothetical protein
MSSHDSGKSVASSIGWGASLVVLLGLFAHQVMQPRSTSSSEPVAPKATVAAAVATSADLSKPDFTVELAPHLSVRIKKSQPPPYLRPIAQFLGVTADELCRGRSSSEVPKTSPAAPPTELGRTKVNNPETGLTKADNASEATTWVNRWGPQVFASEPRFLVALAPDPDRSQSAYRFDLWVEALLRACSAIDPARPDEVYVLDRYFLPWEHSADDPSRELYDSEKVPGVLVLRSVASSESAKCDAEANAGAGGNSNRDRKVHMLVVFLIGETPVAGVQKGALRTALDVVTWFEMERCYRRNEKGGAANKQESPEVRIIGPVFSGSQHSLQIGLQGWWTSHEAEFKDHHRDWKINVVSIGTALRPDDFRPSHLLSNGQPFLNPPPQESNVTLKSTFLPDRVLNDKLFEFLHKMHGDQPIVVAHLRESGTGYGASSLLSSKDNLQVIEIPFPLHISRVHANRERANRRDAESLPQFSAFDRGLRIPVAESEGEADTILERDHLLTPIYQDIVLTSALETLAKQRPQYVLITATDRRDKIFLASAVNRHCPDSRIVLTYSDQLYTHSDYVRYLGGTLVLSCYPVSPIALDWLPPREAKNKAPRQIDSFAEHNIYAYFNAVAAQLGKVGVLRFYQWPMPIYERPLPKSADSPETGSHYGPSVWISQVGPDHADVIQIEEVDVRKFPDVWVPASKVPPDAGEPVPVALACAERTRDWTLCVGAVLVVLLVVIVYGWRVVDDFCRTLPQLSAKRADQANARRRARLSQIIHIAALVTVAGVLGYLTGVEWDRFFSAATGHLPWLQRFDLAVWGVVIIDILFVLLVVWEIRSWLVARKATPSPPPQSQDAENAPQPRGGPLPSQDDRVPMRKTDGLIGWLSTSAGTLFLFGLGFWLAPHDGKSWKVAKIVDVGCWNSPVVPLLLVASIGLFWCWLQASRLIVLNNIETQWDPLEKYSSGSLKGQLGEGWIGKKIEDVIKDHRNLGRSCSDWCDWPLFYFRKWDRFKDDNNKDGEERWLVRLAKAIQPKNLNWFLLTAIAISAYGAYSVRSQWLPSPDGPIVDCLGVGIVLCWLLLCLEAGRLWDFWRRLEALHKAVARLPMQKVFATLPDYFVHAYGDLFFVERYRDSSSPAIAHQLQWVLRKRKELDGGKHASKEFDRLSKEFDKLLSKEFDKLEVPKKKLGRIVREYCLLALPKIAELWSERQVNEGYVSPERAGIASDHATEAVQQQEEPVDLTVPLVGVPGSKEEKMQLSYADERLLGMTIVAYFSQYRLQLTLVAFFLGLAPIALLGAVASYSFMPQRILMDTTALLALLCLALLAWVYTGLNRDEFLSTVAGTAQRRFAINADSITTFVVLLLPLILTIASRLAGGAIMYDWFSSLLHSIASR